MSEGIPGTPKFTYVADENIQVFFLSTISDVPLQVFVSRERFTSVGVREISYAFYMQVI